MWKVKLLCLVLILVIMDTDAVKRAPRYRKRQAGGYAGSGSYAGTGGYAGGYAGGYDDYGTGGFGGNGFDYASGLGAGFIDPYLFHQQLTAQILAQHAAQTNAIVSTLSSGNAQVWGMASALPDNMQMPDNIQIPDNTYTTDNTQLPDDIAIQQQAAHQQAYYGNKPHRYAPNYAAASGSIGPGGYHQTAYVSPANPAVPNIVNRFSSSSPGGYKGVSVSSYSSSSDIDGKRTGHRGAQTTINDNGKITSYRVHS